jgi:hypothetical protein
MVWIGLVWFLVVSFRVEDEDEDEDKDKLEQNRRRRKCQLIGCGH